MNAGRPSGLRRILSLDEAILLGMRRWQTPGATAAMRTFTRLGDTSTWFWTGLVLLASGGSAWRHALLLASAALLATALAQALKRVCRRCRPSSGIAGFTALVDNPDAFSFPSGHTAVACAVAMALAGEGSGLGLLAAGLASGVAISRVYLGAHYPLDVFVGAVIGMSAGGTVRVLLGPVL
jgi:undecaprenyl-diphosphatase